MPTAYTLKTAPGALPLLGHVHLLARRPLDFVAGLSRHADIVRISLGRASAYVVCHPDLVHEVLTRHHVFDKGGPFFDKLRQDIGGGLASCPATQHRQQRRMLQPAFQRDRMAAYATMMAHEIHQATRTWQHGQILDVPSTTCRLTTAITARCLFSTGPQAHGIPVHAYMDEINRGVARRVILPAWAGRLPTPANRRYQHAQQSLRQLTRLLAADYRDAAPDQPDLLSLLTTVRDDDGGPLTDKEIHDQIVTFLLAGMESTAGVIAWALHLIGTHPDVHAQIQAETDAVLGRRPATYDDLPALTTIHAVINETLRLYPPGWLFTRTTTTDTQLGGHRLPARAAIAYSPYLLHHRPDLYAHPDVFDPQRWHHGNPPAHAFIPFGAGPRRCIGATFGTTAAVLTLATLATRWELRPLPGHHARPALGASLAPHPFSMRLHDRGHSCQPADCPRPRPTSTVEEPEEH
jgi:pentalenene oxygenase